MGQVQTKIADSNGDTSATKPTTEVVIDPDSPIPAALQPYYTKFLECHATTEVQVRETLAQKQAQALDTIAHLKQLDQPQLEAYAQEYQTKVVQLSQIAATELRLKAKKAGQAADVSTLVHSVVADSNYRSPLFYPDSSFKFDDEWVREWVNWHRPRWGGMVMDRKVPGLMEMVYVRTRWVDDAIRSTLQSQQQSTQLVILRAGFDTRALRMNLNKCLDRKNDTSPYVHIFEIDQQDVLEDKLLKLLDLSQHDKSLYVAKRIASKQISFAPANQKHGLARTEGYSWERPTIIVMEDITPYVSKDTTADQLTKLAKVVPRGSTLIMTYADQTVLENSSSKSAMQKVVAGNGGQPWITGWTPRGMKEYLDELGYDVEWDTTTQDCYDMYLKVPRATSKWRKGRPNMPLMMERYVVATKRGDVKLW